MKKFQVRPTRQFVIPDDALTQRIFDGTFSVAAGKAVEVKIPVNRRRKIFDTATITNASKHDITLNEFDHAVYDAAISELAAGNEYFTPAVIFRNLGGSVTHSVPKLLKKRIIASLEKLNFLRIALDLSESEKRTRYDTTNVASNGRAMLSVPEKIVFNGVAMTAMKICGSILLDVAEMRKQIRRLEMDSFKIPIHHTERVIAVQHYILRRVAQISGSHNSANSGKKNQRLQPTILLSKLYEHCGFTNLSCKDKERIRKIAAQILDEMESTQLIFGWKWGVEERGEKCSINLDLTPPSDGKAVK